MLRPASVSCLPSCLSPDASTVKSSVSLLRLECSEAVASCIRTDGVSQAAAH